MSKPDFISVGIDVGSEISWASIVTPDQQTIGKPIKIDHGSITSLEAFKNTIKKVEEVNSMKVQIFLESTGIYHVPLFYHLSELGFKTFILNPLITNSNKNIGIRKVKSDKSDSLRIALTAYTANLKTSLVPSDLVLNVRALTREFHKLSDEHTSYLNQLSKELAVVFPSYTKVFSSIVSKTSLRILSVYKTPKNLLATQKEELIEVIMSVSKMGLTKSVITYEKLMEAAKLAMIYSHQLDSSYELIAMKLIMLEHIKEQKDHLLEKLKQILEKSSDSVFAKNVMLIESINGIGFISAVSLMAEIGDYSAFKKPKQLVAYFGIDPSVNQSGKFKGTRTTMSKRGSRIARRVLFIVSLAAIRTSVNGGCINPVMHDYYQMLQERKPKKVAIGAVMRKMTNVIFAVLRDGEVFKMITAQEHCKTYKPFNRTAA